MNMSELLFCERNSCISFSLKCYQLCQFLEAYYYLATLIYDPDQKSKSRNFLTRLETTIFILHSDNEAPFYHEGNFSQNKP